ncbi:CAP domain-containing protein, partial [Kibdelosporangium lantanae]
PAKAAEVVELVNQFRDSVGCDPLKVDSRLTTAAQKHSTDMAQNNFFNHTSAAGTFDQRIRAEGYPAPAAENIAKGQTSAQQVMQSWMQSDGHRRNILNCRYSTIGVGVDKQGWLWTQDFGF